MPTKRHATSRRSAVTTPRKNGHLSALLMCLSVVLLMLGSTSPAFPLRTLQPGSEVPDFTLSALDGTEMNIVGEQGQITVLLFWATETENKALRSLELLRTLEMIGGRYSDQGVVVRSINFDKENEDYLRRLMEDEGITVPVLLDGQEKVYGAYGLFILPMVAIIDRDRTMETAIGYTHNIQAKALGAVEVLLGMKTHDELEEELDPEEVEEAPENVRKAVMHLNLGRKLIERGLAEMAGGEFEKAIEMDPQNAAARAELGTLYVQRKEFEKALVELSKAVELSPDSIEAHLSLGILHREKGELDEAFVALERTLELDPTNVRAISEMGRAYEYKGETEKALGYYRKALSLIFGNEMIR